ncbi:hypothetical protein SAMN02745216_00054 [Desulfatibacillum alkenivorans DSM 16219]|jgi:hypothetical protein|uniref:Uncharacterized protein n=1 Tax=Desulfatibacillum alkenivorans DSM 16219 TaxID=1121393 RepID=A0A1M6BRQ0_9BACT|nr:hypothetical protein [Desulfatibacillum alkenivorans]SHI51386.1 hypothetical protein SAMN02745216_00054 [Desulfatibacillum alkenivorans DSM 16219]
MIDLRSKGAWIPHALMLILAGAILTKMLARPYAFCDDLTHYFPLHQYINGGTPVQTPGAEVWASHSMLVGMKVIFAGLAGFFQMLGAKYPFLAASKFWAMLMLILGYAVWVIYLKKPLGAALGAWAALAIVLFNCINHIITAGLVRSSNVVLIGLWCIALRKRSPMGIALVLLATSFVYPVVLPVLGLSLFAATAWAWKRKETLVFRAGVLILGFLCSIAYVAGKSLFGSRLMDNRPMSLAEMQDILNQGAFSPNLDVPRLIGRLGDQSILEWFQFNLFNHWEPVSNALTIEIGCCSLGVLLAGAFFLKKPAQGRSQGAALALCLIPFAGGFFAFREMDFFLAACWTAALASLGYLFAAGAQAEKALPLELKLLIPASAVAFLLVHAACYKYFALVLDPGRQLQKTFAILAPICTVLFGAGMFEYLRLQRKREVATIAGIVLALYSFYSLDLGYLEYNDQQAMKALKDLPPKAEILCHPQTADIVLIMAGKSASTAHELVRIGAQPYTNNLIQSYARDVDLVYSTSPDKLKAWCRQRPKNGYILAEPEIYTPQEIARLFGPYNKTMEQRRGEGYYLNGEQNPCKELIGAEVSLIPCDCLLQEKEAASFLSEENQ